MGGKASPFAAEILAEPGLLCVQFDPLLKWGRDFHYKHPTSLRDK